MLFFDKFFLVKTIIYEFGKTYSNNENNEVYEAIMFLKIVWISIYWEFLFEGLVPDNGKVKYTTHLTDNSGISLTNPVCDPIFCARYCLIFLIVDYFWQQLFTKMKVKTLVGHFLTYFEKWYSRGRNFYYEYHKLWKSSSVFVTAIYITTATISYA